MANEITVTATLTLDNGDLQFDKSITKSVTMTGDAYQHGIQTIGTSEETVTIVADIGTYGYLLLRNLGTDTADYIEFSTISGQLTGKLFAGEIALFRCDADLLRAKATDAAMDLEFWLIEH